MTLQEAWVERARLRSEGNKFLEEGRDIQEGDRFKAKGFVLLAERTTLRAKGDKLWAETVIAEKGNIMMEWAYRQRLNDFACVLDTGEIFEPIKEEA